MFARESILRYIFGNVPRVIIKTGLLTADGHEEELAEYMCDTPGCPNVAVHVLGVVTGLGLFSAVCQEHVPLKQS